VRPHPIFNDEKLLLNETRVTKKRDKRVSKVIFIREDMQLWIIERTGPYDR
jgi:hypothetical protein